MSAACPARLRFRANIEGPLSGGGCSFSFLISPSKGAAHTDGSRYSHPFVLLGAETPEIIERLQRAYAYGERLSSRQTNGQRLLSHRPIQQLAAGNP